MFIPKCVLNNHVGGGGLPVYLPELVKRKKLTDSGEVVEVSIELVNQAKSLPPAETTDLKTLLDAGVPLDVVKSEMFGSSSVDLGQIPEFLEQPGEPPKQDPKQEPVQDSLNQSSLTKEGA